ncbi:hypothetical protein COUCH_22740 [Couchioplanes caeruleus]|uniref:hypothetical protein n=1 Tax=Couchioplanes caeruleus TaxID=56438 RepID=UPI0020BD9C26|nr:hypothetical protein [Couchioplanes caeruleus]UQU61859.1 hypothetical protein COUCH_22740 [Couchioplanes caeruleus]
MARRVRRHRRWDAALEVTAPATGVLTLPGVRLGPAGAVTGTLTEAGTLVRSIRRRRSIRAWNRGR